MCTLNILTKRCVGRDAPGCDGDSGRVLGPEDGDQRHHLATGRDGRTQTLSTKAITLSKHSVLSIGPCEKRSHRL